MTINRELSQFASFIRVDDSTKNIGIATTSTPSIGIGTTNPSAKFEVVGNTKLQSLNVTGIGTVATLSSPNGIITNLTGTSGTITTLNSTNGTITNLTGTSGTITTFNSTNGTITNLTGTAGTITTLNSTNGTITNGTITNLTGTAGTITTLNSTTGNITNLNSTTGTITNVTVSGITSTGSLRVTGSSVNFLQGLDVTGTASVDALTVFPGPSNLSGSTNLFGDLNVSGIVTATTFVGAITGTVTGTATSTTNIPNLTGDITSVNTVTSIAAGVIVNDDINASAGIVDTKLATISTALKVSNSATTATSANTNNAIVARNASGGFVAGIITATSFSGTATSTTNIPNLTGAITSVNTTTSLGSFSSSDLATALTDETGSGVAVFATSPTLVTPVLGDATATSINVSGITTTGTLKLAGTPGIGITGISSSTSLTENSHTFLPTQAAVKAYVDAVDVTLGINADTGGASTVATSQTLTISGTANEVNTSVSGQTITVGLPDSVTVTTALTTPTVNATNLKANDGTTAITITNSTGAVATNSDLTVGGNLYVNGSTTQVNTTALTVEDRTIDLGIVNGATPAGTTTWDLGVLFNYNSSGAKKSAVIWEHADARFKFASVLASDTDGSTVDTPQLTVTTFAPVEIGQLWVTDCAGTSQVISCTGTERNLENITIDAGTFV